jgi:hypothetical protein
MTEYPRLIKSAARFGERPNLVIIRSKATKQSRFVTCGLMRR